jgi:oxamate amidohydrolase
MTGMVTSPHVLASIEGQRILAAGGNGIEAAIAMGAVLAVVYPHFCGLGGDAVWIVADDEGRSRCFLGIGQAVRDCSRHEGGIPLRGPGSAATSACLVDSWDQAHAYACANWQGSIPFTSLLSRAIELAEGGFPISASQRFWLDFRAAEWPAWPGFASSFDTRALKDGEAFVQRDLAASLRSIAADGPRSFYEGPLARRIAEGLQSAGSPLRADDLAATRTQACDPWTLDYAGHVLLAPPPPTQGLTTLMIMGALRRLGIADVEEGGADFYHLLVEAVKQAFLRRNDIGDPDFSPQPAERYLSPAVLEELAGAVTRHAALPWEKIFRTGDTVFLAAVDKCGRSASVLQSIYFDWGSGVIAGDTGILWQNRAGAFTDGVNALRPGARPFYTLNPGIALKHGRPRLLYGTQGADGQPQTLATVLARVIDHGLDPAAALAAPRFLLGRTFSDSRDTLKLEKDAGAAVFRELRRRGHDVAALPRLSPIGGQAGLIMIDGRTIRGAHDPRSDGVALIAASGASDAFKRSHGIEAV